LLVAVNYANAVESYWLWFKYDLVWGVYCRPWVNNSEQMENRETWMLENTELDRIFDI